MKALLRKTKRRKDERTLLSFPRKRESIVRRQSLRKQGWIPAFAGMTALISFLLVSNTYASPDKATFISSLVWRGDAEGDYTFEGNGKLTNAKIHQDGSVKTTGKSGTYELTTPYSAKGEIYTITSNWSFKGEVTMEISATGDAKNYVPIINGVPLELSKSDFHNLDNLNVKLWKSDFDNKAGSSIKWRATLGPGAWLSEVRILYTDASGVAAGFGNPEISDFMFRKPIYVKGSSSGDLFHYQVPIKVGESSKASGADVNLKGVVQRDFKDARFTAADKETTLPYWLEDITGAKPNRTAIFWVNIPHIPTEGLYIYLYYGNANAEDLSDGNAVFEFFDDFDGVGLDGKKWTATLENELSAVTVSDSLLTLDGAKVMTTEYELEDGIIEYKAKTTGGAIVGIGRGSADGAKTEMAYSSPAAGAENAITVGDSVKANAASAIALGKFYNYRIVTSDGKITFQRYNEDKTKLEAEAEYDDKEGLKKGFVGLSTSTGGKGISYERIFARKFAELAPAVDAAKTKLAQEEAPNIATFRGVEVAPDGALVLAAGETEGAYISPLIHSPFVARVMAPSWATTDPNAKLGIDVSAKEYGTFKEACANGVHYYASKKDFTEGNELRFRARFTGTTDGEGKIRIDKEKEGKIRDGGRGTADDGQGAAGQGTTSAEQGTALERFTMDFRPGTIRLINPNGGEKLAIGQEYKILWQAPDYEAAYPIKLEYSKDGGIRYSLLTKEAKNTGSYAWMVNSGDTKLNSPELSIVSPEFREFRTPEFPKCVVRISDPFDSKIYDASDSYFAILGLPGAVGAEEALPAEIAAPVAPAEEIAPAPVVKEEVKKKLEEPGKRSGTKLYEVLIKARDTYPDAKVDVPGAYKAGDIVMIQPAGHIWGASERADFSIVRMELTEKEVQELMSSDTNAKGETIKRRKHKIDMEKPEIQEKIAASRELRKASPLLDVKDVERKRGR